MIADMANGAEGWWLGLGRGQIGVQKRTPWRKSVRGQCISPGSTYSRTFGTTIGPGSLTAVFGKGTGVSFQVWPPGRTDAVWRDEHRSEGGGGCILWWIVDRDLGAFDTCGQAFAR